MSRTLDSTYLLGRWLQLCQGRKNGSRSLQVLRTQHIVGAHKYSQPCLTPRGVTQHWLSSSCCPYHVSAPMAEAHSILGCQKGRCPEIQEHHLLLPHPSLCPLQKFTSLSLHREELQAKSPQLLKLGRTCIIMTLVEPSTFASSPAKCSSP